MNRVGVSRCGQGKGLGGGTPQCRADWRRGGSHTQAWGREFTPTDPQTQNPCDKQLRGAERSEGKERGQQ